MPARHTIKARNRAQLKLTARGVVVAVGWCSLRVVARPLPKQVVASVGLNTVPLPVGSNNAPPTLNSHLEAQSQALFADIPETRGVHVLSHSVAREGAIEEHVE